MNPKVIRYAIESHANVNHLYDGAPYSLHLAMAVSFGEAYSGFVSTEYHDIVMGGIWCHDIIEDTRQTYNDVCKAVGSGIANIVYAVTNDLGKSRKERASPAYYARIRETKYASFVKMCDRLANVQYSHETNSSMFQVYQKENEEFLENIRIPARYFILMEENLRNLLDPIDIGI